MNEYVCSCCNTVTTSPTLGGTHKWEKIYPIKLDTLTPAELKAKEEALKRIKEREAHNKRILGRNP